MSGEEEEENRLKRKDEEEDEGDDDEEEEEEEYPREEYNKRTSARVLSKKVLLSTSTPQAVVSDPLPLEEEVVKRKRSWEQWWIEDKKTFFEALADCGKDFGAMQNYFKRQKKRNKTKGQIRTFYYRTWHKISAFIQFPDNLKKSLKELYGLINYGELRKRLGVKLDEKNAVKLQELILKGGTTLRIRGKTIRINTPKCTALKNINKLPPGPEMPEKVTLSLHPLRSYDLTRVHIKCLQNPKVKLTLDLNKTIGSVISFLEKKWNVVNSTEKLTLSPQKGVTPKKYKLFFVEPVTSASLSLSRVAEETREETPPLERLKSSEAITHPWDSGSNLSLGEMFIMFGSSDINLLYSFEGSEVEIDRRGTLASLVRLIKDKKKKPPPVVTPASSSRDKDSEFRIPDPIPLTATAFKEQIDLLLPKYKNARPLVRRTIRGASHRLSSSDSNKTTIPTFKLTPSILPPTIIRTPEISNHSNDSFSSISLPPFEEDENNGDSVRNLSLLQTPDPLRSEPPSPISVHGSESAQWLADISLPSFLSSDSQHTNNSEVDRNVADMMTETSLDFSSKFAKLASHLNSDS